MSRFLLNTPIALMFQKGQQDFSEAATKHAKYTHEADPNANTTANSNVNTSGNANVSDDKMIPKRQTYYFMLGH
jgi:hypothetical protein